MSLIQLGKVKKKLQDSKNSRKRAKPDRESLVALEFGVSLLLRVGGNVNIWARFIFPLIGRGRG